MKSWEKNTNNKTIFETLMKHHIKGAFADNILAIMEERGVIDHIYVVNYPVYEAAKNPEAMNMRVKVKRLEFICKFMYNSCFLYENML